MDDIDYMMSKKARIDICEMLRGNADADQLKKLKSFDIPRSLYRYSRIDSYTLANLKNNEITATAPTEFNDIYDSVMHFDSYAEGLALINESNELCKEAGLPYITDRHDRDLLLQDSDERDKHKATYLTKKFKVNCLSTSFKKIQMWSHYANNNKGICIQYDFSKSNLSKLLYPVIYIDKPIDVTRICQDPTKVITATLCSMICKFRDWEDEEEWRLIVYGWSDAKKRCQLRNIPNPEYIFLGNRFIQHYRQVENNKDKNDELLLIEELLDYVKTSNIKLNIMNLQFRSFNLEFRDIDVDEVRKVKSMFEP